MKAAWRWLVRVFRTAILVIRDTRIPKWARAVMAVGCFVPIPGPFDEIFACLCLGIVWLFWRPVLHEAWQDAAS